MNPAFIQSRIDSTEALIVVYEDAILALGTGGVQEYRLDTGQTVTNVTKFDILDMQKVLDSLMNRLETLNARLYGTGTIIVRPAF